MNEAEVKEYHSFLDDLLKRGETLAKAGQFPLKEDLVWVCSLDLPLVEHPTEVALTRFYTYLLNNLYTDSNSLREWSVECACELLGAAFIQNKDKYGESEGYTLEFGMESYKGNVLDDPDDHPVGVPVQAGQPLFRVGGDAPEPAENEPPSEQPVLIGRSDIAPLYAYACHLAKGLGVPWKALELAETFFAENPVRRVVNGREEGDNANPQFFMASTMYPWSTIVRSAIVKFEISLLDLWIMLGSEVGELNRFDREFNYFHGYGRILYLRDSENGDAPTHLYGMIHGWLLAYFKRQNPYWANIFSGFEDSLPVYGPFSVDDILMSFTMIGTGAFWEARYATKTVEEALTVEEEKADTLAEAMMSAGEREGAMSEAFRQLVEDSKAEALAKIELVRTSSLFSQAKYKDAILSLRKAEFLSPSTPSPAVKAACLVTVGAMQEAESVLARAQDRPRNEIWRLWSLGRLQYEEGRKKEGLDIMQEARSHPLIHYALHPSQVSQLTLLCEEAYLEWAKHMPEQGESALEVQEERLRGFLASEVLPSFRLWGNIVLAENLEAQRKPGTTSSLQEAVLDSSEAKSSLHWLSVRGYAALSQYYYREGKRAQALEHARKAIGLLEHPTYRPRLSAPSLAEYWTRPWLHSWKPLYELTLELELGVGQLESAFSILQGLVQHSLADTFAGFPQMDLFSFLTPHQHQQLKEIRSHIDNKLEEYRAYYKFWRDLESSPDEAQDKQEEWLNKLTEIVREVNALYTEELALLRRAEELAGIPLASGIIRSIPAGEVAEALHKYGSAVVAHVWLVKAEPPSQDEQFIIFLVTVDGLQEPIRVSPKQTRKILDLCKKAKAESEDRDSQLRDWRTNKVQREALRLVAREFIKPILRGAKQPDILYLAFPPGPLWSLAWAALPRLRFFGLKVWGFLSDRANVAFLAYGGHLVRIHQRWLLQQEDLTQCLAIGSKGSDLELWPLELLPPVVQDGLPEKHYSWEAHPKATTTEVQQIQGDFHLTVLSLHNTPTDQKHTLSLFEFSDGVLPLADMLCLLRFKSRYIFCGTCESAPVSEAITSFEPWVSIAFGLLENKHGQALVGTSYPVSSVDIFLLGLAVAAGINNGFGLAQALRRAQHWVRSVETEELVSLLEAVKKQVDSRELIENIDEYIKEYLPSNDQGRFFWWKRWLGHRTRTKFAQLHHWAGFIPLGDPFLTSQGDNRK